MKVLANLDLPQHMVRPKANTSAIKSTRNQATTNTTKNYSISEQEVWSDEDDQKLRDMKTANPSMGWKEVVAALGGNHSSESQARSHWKDIQGKPVSSVAAGGANNENITKEEKKAKAKTEGLTKQAAANEEKGGKGAKKGILKKVAAYLLSSCGAELLLTYTTSRATKRSPQHPKRTTSSPWPPNTTRRSGLQLPAGTSIRQDRGSAQKWRK